MLAIEKFNTFYHAQALMYEAEIYPTAHTAIPDLIKTRMREGHVALAYAVWHSRGN